MVIRELLIRLGLNGGAQVNRELDKVDGGVNKTMQSFSALGGVIAGVFAGLTLKSILDTADHMQSLEFRLGQMITSANGGTEALENLAQHARESRVDIESYAEAYTGIGAATHELIHTEQDLLKVTDSVAKGLQLAGASTQQTTSVMMQLTQAIAVGKLQWADMRIIMQNSDAFALRIAKSMGMTLNQMVQATQGNGGGIGADKLVNALRSMSDEVNAEFKQMPLTFTQGLTIIGTRWDMFVHRLNRSTGAVTWIADKFLWFADKVEFSLDRVVEALGGAENAVKLLGVVLGAAGLVAGVWALTAAFAALTSPITLTIGALALLYLVFDDISNWYQGNASLFGDIFGPIGDHVEDVKEMRTAMSDLLVVVKALWRGIVALKNALNELPGADTVKSIGDALGTTKFAPWLSATASNYLEGIKGTAKDVNRATYGVFDVPQMWSDAMRGLTASNQNTSPESLSPPQQRIQSSTQYGLTRPDVTVTIGNITVPAGTTEQQQSFLRDSAQKTFNEVGWSKMADNMNFNTGG